MQARTNEDRGASGLVELWAATFGDLTLIAPEASLKPALTKGLTHPFAMALAETRAGPRAARGPAIPESLHIKELVGEGGMGRVFRAEQAALGRDIALKKIAGRGREDQLANFIAEARITARLDHPNIVPVHDLRQSDEGELMLAMKLVNGAEWSRLIHPEEGEDETPLDRHLEILLKVCDAVAFAHSRGIVHCDLKPENVMVGEYGEVLVMDWGIALAFEDSQAAAGIPRARDTDRPRGTPLYMAPELAEGRGELIGPRTDVYLLGAILYEIIEGRPPHQALTLAGVLSKAEQGRPAFSGERPLDELVELCLSAMARRPSERLASVEEFQAAIRDYRSHSESRRLARGASAILEEARRLAAETRAEQSREAIYAGFAEAISGFRQAAALWPESPEACAGEAASRQALAESALAFGDLGLADAQVRRLEDGGDLRAAIDAARARSEEARRSRRVLRRAVRGLAAALVLGLGLASAVLYRSERAARLSEAAAEESRAKAEDLRRASERDRARAVARLGEVFLERAQAARRDGAPLAGRALLRQAFETVGARDETAGAIRARLRTEWARFETLAPKRLWSIGRSALPAPKAVFQDAKGRLLVWTDGQLRPLKLEEERLGPAIEIKASELSVFDFFRADDQGLALNPDRRSLAVVSQQAGTRIISLDEGRSVRLPTQKELGPAYSIDRVAFCPGAEAIVAGFSDEVAVWSRDGRFRRRIAALKNGAIFGDARRERFYALDHRGDLITVSLRGQRLAALDLPGDPGLDAAAISRDGRWLVLAPPRRQNRPAPRLDVVDLAGPEPALARSLPLETRIASLSFGEGSLLAAVDREGRVERWELSSGRSLGACETRRLLRSIELLPGDKALLIDDSGLALWDLNKGRALRQPPPRIIDFALRNRELVVLRDHPQALQFLDPESGRLRDRIALPLAARARRFLRLAASEERLAIAGEEGGRLVVWVFAEDGGRAVFSKDVRSLILAAEGRSFGPSVYEQPQELRGFALSSSGRWLAIASQQALVLCDLDEEDGAPRLLPLLELAKASALLPGDDLGCRSLLSFVGDEKLVASLGSLVSFRLPEGARQLTSTKALGALGVGEAFLTRRSGGDIALCDKDGARRYAREALAESLAVSLRPARFAIGERDGSLKVYGLEDGALQARLDASERAIVRLAFAPGRERLFGLDEAGELQAWRLSGLELRAPLLSEKPDSYAMIVAGLETRFRPCASGERFARMTLNPPAIELWDRRARLGFLPLSRAPDALAIGPRGRRLAAVIGGRLRAWSWEGGALEPLDLPGLEADESWSAGRLEPLSVSERGLLAISDVRGLLFLPFAAEDRGIVLAKPGLGRQGHLNRQGSRALTIESVDQDQTVLRLRDLEREGRVLYEAADPNDELVVRFSRDGRRAYWLEEGKGLIRYADGAATLLRAIPSRAVGFLMLSPDERYAAFALLLPFPSSPDVEKLLKSMAQSFRFEVLDLRSGERILRFQERDSSPVFMPVSGDDGLWGLVGDGELRLRRWSPTFEEPRFAPEAAPSLWQKPPTNKD